MAVAEVSEDVVSVRKRAEPSFDAIPDAIEAFGAPVMRICVLHTLNMLFLLQQRANLSSCLTLQTEKMKAILLLLAKT